MGWTKQQKAILKAVTKDKMSLRDIQDAMAAQNGGKSVVSDLRAALTKLEGQKALERVKEGNRVYYSKPEANPKPTTSTKGGRPFKYDPEELDALIEEYFEESGIHARGHPIKPESFIPPSISSLAIHLDTNRATIANYTKKDEYVDSIKRAKLRVEAFNEWMLATNGKPTGTIFSLKNNFGWSDKVEIKETGNKKPHVVIKLPDNGRGKPAPKTQGEE